MKLSIALFALAYLLLIAGFVRANHNAHKRDFIAGIDDYQGP